MSSFVLQANWGRLFWRTTKSCDEKYGNCATWSPTVTRWAGLR